MKIKKKKFVILLHISHFVWKSEKGLKEQLAGNCVIVERDRKKYDRKDQKHLPGDW